MTSLSTTAPTRVAAIATRLGLTEGQLYTVVIVFAAGLLLLPSLGSLNTAPTASVVPIPAPVAAPAPTSAPPAGPAQDVDRAEPTVTPTVPPRPVLPPVAIQQPGTAPRPASPAPVPPPVETAPTPIDIVIDDLGPITGVAIADDGSVLVASAGSPEALAALTRFDRAGNVLDRVRLGGDPRNTVTGDVVVVGGRALVADRGAGLVYAYDLASGSISRAAELPDLPLCLLGSTGDCQVGAFDTIPDATDLAAAADGTIFVSDSGQAAVWRLDATSLEPELYHQSPEYASVDGLVVDADDQLFVVTTDAATPPPFERSTIHALVEDATGVVRTPITSSEPGTTWDDLALLSDGSLVVTSPEQSGLTVIAADGTTSTLQEAAGHTLVAPAAVTVHDGGLVIADDTSTEDAHAARVVETPAAAAEWENDE